jgi:hypothetical protein
MFLKGEIMKNRILYSAVFLVFVSIISLEAQPLYAEGVLAITEIMGMNSKILDEDGDSADWIEIHNGTQKKINLEGYGLSDKFGDLSKWVFPAKEIDPDEYLIVFASGKNRSNIDGQLHTNFKLSERDEGVYLSYGQDSLISYMGIEKFSEDISCGRKAESGRIEYFSQPTPGKANTTPAFSPVVKYSLNGGFYASSVSVELYTDGGASTIYYTMDGSTPTEASKVYSAPIKIDKNVTIRAVSLEEGHFLSPPSGHAYFIDFANKGIPIVAIATESEKLWDPQAGLFRDVEYSDYMLRETVRVQVSYFDENGTLGFSQDALMSVCGAGSRELMMRPLKITASNTADPLNSKFRYKLFDEEIDAHRHFQLRNNNQDGMRYVDTPDCMPTLGIRNALFCEIFYGQEGIEMRNDKGPALLFINGKNYGIMNISEKRDNTGIKENNPSVKAKDVDLLILRDDMGFRVGRNMMKKGTPFIREDGKVLYKGYFMDGAVEYEEVSESARRTGSTAAVDDFISIDFTDPSQLDPESFIATMAAHIISCNTDFGINNLAFWRISPQGEKPGPFYTYSFDFDSVFGIEKWHEDYDTFLRYEEQTNFFSEFLKKEEYRTELIRKIDEFLNGPFRPEETIPIIDKLQKRMEPWIEYHLDMWAQGKMDKKRWEENVEYLKKYMSVRPAHMRKIVENYFGFLGYSDMEFSVIPSNTGAIYRHKAMGEILLSGKGSYAKIPMNIFAKASKGYKFSHFMINGERVPDPDVTLNLEDTMNIEAFFTEDRLAPVANVCINEIVRSGNLKIKDEDGDKADWAELFNATEESIDLTGMYLTDKEHKLTKWQFPNVSIGGGKFLIVFLSGKDKRKSDKNLHTSFKLSEEPLLLVDKDGKTVIDRIAQETMRSLPENSCGARYPDGTSKFALFRTASPGMSNESQMKIN